MVMVEMSKVVNKVYRPILGYEIILALGVIPTTKDRVT